MNIFNLTEDEIKFKLQNISNENIQRVLNKQNSYTVDDFIALISIPAENFIEQLAQKAAAVKNQRFGKTVKLYCPIYVSNKCSNACLYCGFKAANKIIRKTLTFNEIESEAKKIKEFGFDSILIVSGERPDEINIDYLLGTVKILKKYFSYIAIEIYPLNENEYKILADAGVDGLTLYQETYNKEKYAEMHPYGKKRNYDYRIGSLERGANAGIKELTCGVLLGLYDWRIDSVFMVMHAKHLMKKCWRSKINFSFPRIRPSASGFNTEYPVSDKNFVQLVAALRICFQDAGLSLSTRESSNLRDNMLNIGITHISAGSKTNPGGYNDTDAAEEQFKISDERSPYQISELLQTRGFDPVWKDWDNHLKIII